MTYNNDIEYMKFLLTVSCGHMMRHLQALNLEAPVAFVLKL